MEKFNKRSVQDRRNHPTIPLSRFTLWGRRKNFRRGEDKKRGGYVDRYDPGLLTLLVFVIGLNILDVLFTMNVLDNGGLELNPVARSAIEIYQDRFWVWKFVLVAFPLILLCLHSKFRHTRSIIMGITIIYTGLIFHQILLFIYG